MITLQTNNKVICIQSNSIQFFEVEHIDRVDYPFRYHVWQNTIVHTFLAKKQIEYVQGTLIDLGMVTHYNVDVITPNM